MIADESRIQPQPPHHIHRGDVNQPPDSERDTRQAIICGPGGLRTVCPHLTTLLSDSCPACCTFTGMRTHHQHQNQSLNWKHQGGVAVMPFHKVGLVYEGQCCLSALRNLHATLIIRKANLQTHKLLSLQGCVYTEDVSSARPSSSIPNDTHIGWGRSA